MSQSSIDKLSAKDLAGTLHAGVDLALENNLVVVVNEKAQPFDHFSFRKLGEVMTTFDSE